MWCTCYFNQTPGASPDYKITYLVNRKSTNLVDFIKNVYNGIYFTQLISASGFNLYGCGGNTVIWANNSSTGGDNNGAWSNDGTFIKYGLNITGVK
jgi:hypothetical protein